VELQGSGSDVFHDGAVGGVDPADVGAQLLRLVFNVARGTSPMLSSELSLEMYSFT